MHWINIGAVFIGGLNVGLALLVYLRNPRNKINIAFSLAALCLGLWTASEALFRESQTEQTAFFWGRFENLFGASVALIFFIFAHYFPYEEKRISKTLKLLMLSTYFGMMAVVLIPGWHIESVSLQPPFTTFYLNVYGRVYYTLFFFFYVISGYYLLIKKYFSIDGILRSNIFTVILGTVFLGSFSTFFGVLTPMVSGHDNPWFASYFSVPMILIMTWFMLFNGKRISIR